jgi:hypothetical protein
LEEPANKSRILPVRRADAVHIVRQWLLNARFMIRLIGLNWNFEVNVIGWLLGRVNAWLVRFLHFICIHARQRASEREKNKKTKIYRALKSFVVNKREVKERRENFTIE